ncbi:hypothetical protein NDU88_011569 [Pleurodeles waltl]|uniref:Uncharacterized protein n=1 Tax=Pleurodeles waltl TaxID=8319 RepID=A0AAV7PY45_PLEWA|nr:hypothetical protein NDU88_011569 [Pleurodeles waltl]
MSAFAKEALESWWLVCAVTRELPMFTELTKKRTPTAAALPTKSKNSSVTDLCNPALVRPSNTTSSTQERRDPLKGLKRGGFHGPPDDPGNPPSMSIPAIVGIVIAGLLAVILVVVLVYYCRTKSSKVQSTTEAISRGTTHVNNGAQTNTNSRGSPEETYYTAVRFEPKTQKARAPPPLENTIYSQVKTANHHGLPPTPPSPETIIYSEARLTCEGKSVRPPPTENTIYSQVKTTHHK